MKPGTETTIVFHQIINRVSLNELLVFGYANVNFTLTHWSHFHIELCVLYKHNYVWNYFGYMDLQSTPKTVSVSYSTLDLGFYY